MFAAVDPFRQPEPADLILGAMTVMVLGGFVVLQMFPAYAEARTAMAGWRAAVEDRLHRKLKRLIDEEVCRHGLTSDTILDTLLGLDHFSFVMDAKVCTCVRREDGTYDFGFPTPRSAAEAIHAQAFAERAGELIAAGQAANGEMRGGEGTAAAEGRP